MDHEDQSEVAGSPQYPEATPKLIGLSPSLTWGRSVEVKLGQNHSGQNTKHTFIDNNTD